ncbi:MAG: hypothetical protein HY909_10425 [Deltaproteobacteria bacterium]|nr:hypothetical protein [Deltaproteobacteria bacterium]
MRRTCGWLVVLALLGACKKRGLSNQGGGGDDPPTPPLPPGTQTIRWSDDAVGYAGRDFGVPHRVYCPARGTAGPVFGAELYSVRSSICTAAVHLRRITLAAGGVVTFYSWPASSRVFPSLRQGIQSQEALRDHTFTFTPYVPKNHLLGLELLGRLPPQAYPPRVPHDPLPAAPPAPAPAPVGPPEAFSWRDNATRWRGQNDTAHAVLCPPMDGNPSRNIWGDGIYTDDSPVCAAALHAGRITAAGGPVTLYITFGMPRYDGAERNGVRTRNFGRWRGSYLFRWVPPRTPPIVPPTPTRITWQATAEQLRGVTAREAAFACPPGDLPEPVWGGGEGTPFVDESSICTAGVFAGVISFQGGGIVRIHLDPGVNTYAAGDQNEVSSGLTFGDRNRQSFTVLR